MRIQDFSNRRELVTALEAARKKQERNEPVSVLFGGYDQPLEVYPASVRNHPRGGVLLAGRFNDRDALFILGKETIRVMNEFDGEIILHHSDFSVKKCRWTRGNTLRLRELFSEIAPSSGQNGKVSISFGDVLGHAGRAQLLAFKGKADPAFSRQCIHQLEELEIHPLDALDTVTRTVFQEGYDGGYSAEACRLTTPDQVRTMLHAGYTRFSMETSGPIRFALRSKPKKELLESMFDVPWIGLKDKFELLFHRYKGIRIDLGPVRLSKQDGEQQETMILLPGEAEILAAIRILSGIIFDVIEMEKVLVEEGKREDVILELSFAHPEGALTPFELYYLVTELHRHDIRLDFVAPGDLSPEYWAVARITGLRGLSGELRHLDGIPRETETSGLRFHGVVGDISYLTAVQCMARMEPGLFREIWTLSRNVLEKVREESGLDLPIQKIPPDKEYSDDDLPELLSMEWSDLFLKHTMDEVFARKDEQGKRFLRTAVFEFIKKNEPDYTDALLERYREVTGR